MKLFITILAVLNGGFMLTDGIYVMVNNKYIGPPRPGPWANLFYLFNVDVFKLGPLFVVYGLLWLVWVYALWTKQTWAWVAGISVCLLTLWYLPIGTLFSIIILGVLFFARSKLGI